MIGATDADGLPAAWSSASPNAVCLNCHSSTGNGVDPDGTATTYTKKAKATKTPGAAHDGVKHTAGTDGGKFCWDCHDPHGDRPSNTNSGGNNIVIVHRAVVTATDGTLGYATATRAVEFYNKTPPVASDTGEAGSVGKIVETATALGTNHKGLCQACHTVMRNLLGLVAVGAGFSLLIITERRQPNPLLHRELWLNRSFLLGAFGVLLAFACVMGAFFLLPFFLVQIYFFPPAKVGLMLAVLALSKALMSFLGGYLADRVGNVRILRIGLGFICVGLFSVGAATPQTSTLSLAGRLALTGMGLGIFSAPNLNEILRGVQPKLMGLAASTSAVLKNLGALLGVIVLVAALGWEVEGIKGYIKGSVKDMQPF